MTIIAGKNNGRYLSIIIQAISTVLGVSKDEINHTAATATFVEIGGDSLSAILISAECQHRGITIPAGVFLRVATVAEIVTRAASLAKHLPVPPPTPPATPGLHSHHNDRTTLLSLKDASYEAQSKFAAIAPEHAGSQQDLSHDDAGSPLSAGSLLGHINTSEWTEVQLLLLRETARDPRLNMLTTLETYTGDWNPHDLSATWTGTIVAEPIFQNLICDLDVSPQDFMHQEIIGAQTENEYEERLQIAANANGPISKLTVIQSPWSLSSDGYETIRRTTVVWRIHHAFLDGYSVRILHEKVARNIETGRISVAAGPSFRKIVRSLRGLRDETRESTRRFWETKREELPAATGELRLSPQRERDDTEELHPQRSASVEFSAEDLAAATSHTGYTTTVYFAAAWALTLSKFMDTDEICFGMVLSGRDLPIIGAFDVVGPTINILPLLLRVPTKGDGTSVEAFLRRVHDSIVELLDLQHTIAADAFEKPFDSILATQFQCDQGNPESQTTIPMDQNRPAMQSGVPLNLIIEQQCRLQAFYSTARYCERDMNNLLSVFHKAMISLLKGGDANRSVSSVTERLLPQKMEQMLREWSNCASKETLDSSKGDDLVTLFENVVARQPHDAAVLYDEHSRMSYIDFDNAAAVVAKTLGWIRPNEAVCVYAERSVNWLIAMFGVLKAGGVYTPLDPTAPASMQHANLIRSGARVLLFPSRTAQTRRFGSPRQREDDVDSSKCHELMVDELLATEGGLAHGSCPAAYPRRRIARPDDLAYICFTSGSTGVPKAVQCTHKGLVAFQKDRNVRLGANKGVIVAQVMSPVFDGSIHEIFSALTHGAALRLPIPNQESPFAHLHQSDSAILTPSVAKVLEPDQYPSLQNVYFVGETVPQSLADAWARNRFLYNMYGPTEATCGATIKHLRPNEPVSLGRPNLSSRVYILDRSQHILPPGAVGELYLAGIQVSEGYINLSEMNRTRFLTDSIMPGTGQMMYRTGDFAYWDSVTGEICILGRQDRQIKLRGFRLDLDDLEARIMTAIPGCGGAAVFRRDDYLVAAYQSTSASGHVSNELDIKALVGSVLPPYAMPRRIIALEHFPLTAAGKLDQKNIEAMLSASMPNSASEVQYEDQKMSATEKMVVDIVRSLLKLEPRTHIDQSSDLASLGGHSIMQIQLANRISSFLERRLTVRTVIENPIIADLASVIDDARRQDTPVDTTMSARDLNSSLHVDANLLGETEVSPIELEWLWKYRCNLGTSSFNVTHLSELSRSFVQHQALISAWNNVLARHSILRCRFRQNKAGNGRAERSCASEPPRALYVEDYDLRAAINTEFSLETEPPIRVFISKHHMLICLSHIICDYTTLGLLFDEFTAAYFGGDRADLSSLAPRRRYQDTSCWNIAVDESTAEFWTSYLSQVSPPPYMKTARTSYAGSSLMFRLSEGAMPSIEALSHSLFLTPHQVALAVVSLVLQTESSSKQDLILGSPFLGRQEDDMQTVGLFLQPIPIRIRRTSNTGKDDYQDAPVASFLQDVQSSAQSALGNGIEWASLMRILASSSDESLRQAAAATIPNHPLFEAMVTFHDLSASGKPSTPSVNMHIPGIQPLVNWADGAKFGIMFEFSALGSSSVTLRIEYDTSLFSEDEVRLLVARIDAGLDFISQKPSLTTLAEIESELLAIRAEKCANGDSPVRGIRAVEFGTPLSTLI